MRSIVFGILLLSFNCFSQGYVRINDSYKGHEFINENTGSKPIQNFINSIVKEKPSINSDLCGEIRVIFNFDSVYNCHEIEVINMVNSYYDSLVSKAFENLGKTELGHLEKDKMYGLIIQIGAKKQLDNLTLGIIMFASGKTEKSEKIYSKLLSNSPDNTQILLYLGRSMINNENKEGMVLIQKAADLGDVDAIKYLTKNKP